MFGTHLGDICRRLGILPLGSSDAGKLWVAGAKDYKRGVTIKIIPWHLIVMDINCESRWFCIRDILKLTEAPERGVV